jgi:hypothetical protein
MAKKQRRGVKSRSTDPVGKLLREYRPNQAAAFGLAILVILVGVGLITYGFFHRPFPVKLTLIGGFLVLCGPALLAISAFNFGRSLQLRQHGVRLIDRGFTTEFAWDEIADVEVKRADVTSLGIATLVTRRSDLRGSGLLTARTEWEIIIHGHDGRMIHLSRSFLQYLPDVRSLVIRLRSMAGLEQE